MMDDPENLEDMSHEQLAAILGQVGVTPRPPRVRPKTDWSVDELYDAALPASKWIVPDLLPAGLASLAGRPKLGKSWLALQLAAAVALGRPFLGFNVEAGPAVFVALEDPPRRLHDRLQALDVPRSAPIKFYTDWPSLHPGSGGLHELHQCLAEVCPRLVVIDTLALAFRRGPAANASTAVYASLFALRRLAQNVNCCILTIDHHKKPGHAPDVVDDLLGSTGKAAVIDTAWGLYREPGHRNLTLHVAGRDVTASTLTLEFDSSSHSWQLGPEPSLALKDSVMMDVAGSLAALGGVATTSELALRLGMPVGNVSRALSALVAAGWVRRLPRQGRRVPYQLLS